LEEEQPTCGRGLAAGAGLPAKLAKLMSARAEVLERHTRALDLGDAAGRQELEAYTALVRAHREIAAELARLAERMSGYGGLPMAPHDTAVLADPRGQEEAFQRFQALERELIELLQDANSGAGRG
jgi:hypothetical protein